MYCIKPKEMEQYLINQTKYSQTIGEENIQEDPCPCVNCKHFACFETPGTFVEMKTVFHKSGRFHFEELHKCYSCGTIFRFDNTPMKCK